MPDLQFTESNASFSSDRRHRFALWRIWSREPKVMFIGLNPSTANETANDPTIRRCIQFARDWGYGGIYMCNLFGLVSTDPTALVKNYDSVGLGNDLVLQTIRDRCRLAVAAWGDFNKILALKRHRAEKVTEMLQPLKCFGINKNGSPKHPLYLRKDTELIDYI